MPKDFDFEQQCADLLRERRQQSLSSPNMWDDYLNHGISGNLIAGEHEDRDILELLQNARDAIARGQEPTGCILIAVTETAIVIANTGEPFRLDDEQVFRAVSLLGESNKAANEGMIGHKGIGMKSILQRAGKFSIRSRLTPEQTLCAEFSRARTYRALEDAIAVSPLRQHVYQRLPKLPLFRTPHATPNADVLLQQVAQGLQHLAGLTSQASILELDAYSTALTLYYQDAEWEKILEDIRPKLASNEPAVQEFERARQNFRAAQAGQDAHSRLWQLLSDPQKLDPRTFILLGHIRQLQMVYFQNDGQRLQPTESRTYAITSDAHDHTDLTETIWKNGETETLRREFVLFTRKFDTQSAEQVRLLIERPAGKLNWTNQPLYLYYPIQLALSGLPWIIHGPFLVTPSRKELAQNGKANKHNQQILDAAAALLREKLPNLLADENYQTWLPWLLLPVTLDNSQSLAGQRISKLLGDAVCVPLPGGQSACRPDEVFFMPERPRAFELFDFFGQAEEHPFLHSANRQTFDQRLVNMAQEIGLGKFNRRTLFHSLVAVFSKLRASTAGYPLHSAHQYFAAVCYLLEQLDRQSPEDAASLAALIGQQKGGTPLFPFELGDDALLATAIARPKYSEPDNLRIIFLLNAMAKESKPSTTDDVDVFLLRPDSFGEDRKLIEDVVRKYSEAWDVISYQGPQDLFLRVADRLDEYARQASREKVFVIVGYLAGLLKEINDAKEKDLTLSPRPYAAINFPLLQSYLKSGNSEAHKLLSRWQDWLRQIEMPASNGAYYPLQQLVFGANWAAVAESLVDGARSERRVRWAKAIRALSQLRASNPIDGCCEIAGPDHELWAPAFEQIQEMWPDLPETESPSTLLMDLLVLLGVRIGPRIEWRWLSKSGKEHDAISRTESAQILKGELSVAKQADFNGASQSEIFREYIRLLECIYPPSDDTIRITDYRLVRTLNAAACQIYAWVWFPDLIQTPPDSELFLQALLPLWPEIETFLETGWVMKEDEISRWVYQQNIPSLAKYQLLSLELWAAADKPRWAEKLLPEISTFPFFAFDLWHSRPAMLRTVDADQKATVPDGKPDAISQKLTSPEVHLLLVLLRLDWLLRHMAIQEIPARFSAQTWSITELTYDLQSTIYRLLRQLKELRLSGRASHLLTLPAVQANAWRAVPFANQEAFKQLRYFAEAPKPWEVEKMDTWLLALTDRGALPDDLQSLCKSCGVQHIVEPVPTYPATDRDLCPQITAEMIQRLIERLPLIEGIFKLNRVENVPEKIGTIQEIIQNKRIRAVPERPDMLWAFEDDQKPIPNLIYFAEDYAARNIAVIAFGLAQRLKLFGSTNELILALTADRKIIEAELKRKGIDLASPLQVLQLRLRQAAELIGANLTAQTHLDPLPKDEKEVIEIWRSIAPESSYPLFWQIVPLCRKTDLTEIDWLRQVVGVLRQDPAWAFPGQELEWMQPIAATFNRQYAVLHPALVFTGWVASHGVDEITLIDDLRKFTAELARKANPLWIGARFRDFDIACDMGFIIEMSAVEIPTYLKTLAQSQMSVAQNTEIWEQIEAYYDTLFNLPPKPDLQPDPVSIVSAKSQLEECFTRSTSVVELPVFDLAAGVSQVGTTASDWATPIKLTDKGDLPQVTLRQGLRGRIAELYVLDVCWQRFVANVQQRVEVCQAVQTYYEQNPWLQKLRPQAIPELQTWIAAPDQLPEKQAFYAMLDLTAIGLAGFDILATQKLWPTQQKLLQKEDHEVYCAEVKSVAANGPDISAAEIILTTHEYRMAITNPHYPYLLRLIYVPARVWPQNTDFSGVKFIRDIDINKIARIDEKKIEDVRGGHFSLRLTWDK